MSQEPNATFRIFAALFCLCCISHFTTQLGAAQFEHAGWWLACGIAGSASLCLLKFSFRRFLFLLNLQLAHVVVEAPFSPDHWLLLLLANVLIQFSMLSFWMRGKAWTETDLLNHVGPAIRCTFLICYGYAAFSKLNTHFLGTDSSCARELAEFQAQVSPWLKYVMLPKLAGWMTVLCESLVALLLIPRRTRRYGILVGVLFHTILAASPAIAVFDFTMIVYTMLFLFAGNDIGDRWNNMQRDFWQKVPALQDSLTKLTTYVLLLIPVLVIARSLYQYQLQEAGLEAFKDYWVSLSRQLTWLANMTIATVVIGCTIRLLFSQGPTAPPSQGKENACFRPAFSWQYVILALALFNGLCPYLGLKTQGSFTMFSNLRTEGDHWNHLIAPRWLRVVDQFQDDLIHVTHVDHPRLQRDFVDQNCLVPAFEIRRAAERNPQMSISIEEDGTEVRFAPIALHHDLAKPLGFLAKKLLIFRPVTSDGSPYCGN